MLLWIGIVLRRIWLFLILYLMHLLIAILVTFMRDHVLRWRVNNILFDHIWLVLNIVNGAYPLSTLWGSPRTFGRWVHLFLRVLLVKLAKLLRAFRVPAVLEVAVILVNSLYFPWFTLSCISHILVLDLLVLKILKRLRVPMQFKLVVLKALSIKIVLQVIQNRLLLLWNLAIKLVVVQLINIVLVVRWILPTCSNWLHFNDVFVDANHFIVSICLSNQILGRLVFH